MCWERLALSRGERALIDWVKAAEPWESMLYELCYVVPTFAIIGVGAYAQSLWGVATGMFIFGVFHASTLVHQRRVLDDLKSLFRKVEESGSAAETGKSPAQQRGG